MNQRIRTSILTAATLTLFVAPALADMTICTVTAPEIRLRKSPSKKSHVIAILKKDDRVTSVGKCSGGWVKVASENGKLKGYVGGWAIADVVPKAAASTVTPQPEVAKVEAPAPGAPRMEIPSNEQLAVQITQLRLNVLSLDRDMEKMNKEIQKIKSTISRKSARKGHKRSLKKV
jgi:uncharacterized protein YgiM (DUF1202 family)